MATRATSGGNSADHSSFLSSYYLWWLLATSKTGLQTHVRNVLDESAMTSIMSSIVSIRHVINSAMLSGRWLRWEALGTL